MRTVDMLQAASSLPDLVDAIEQGREMEIVIERNGRPAAKLVPIEFASVSKRIGVAKGVFDVPESIDTSNEEIARLFMGDK